MGGFAAGREKNDEIDFSHFAICALEIAFFGEEGAIVRCSLLTFEFAGPLRGGGGFLPCAHLCHRALSVEKHTESWSGHFENNDVIL